MVSPALMGDVATMPLPMPGMGWIRHRWSRAPPDWRNQRRKLASTSDVVCLLSVDIVNPINVAWMADLGLCRWCLDKSSLLNPERQLFLLNTEKLEKFRLLTHDQRQTRKRVRRRGEDNGGGSEATTLSTTNSVFGLSNLKKKKKKKQKNKNKKD